MKNQMNDLALLLLRLVFGGFMLVGHGWVKLMNFQALSTSFPDPLGIGPALSYYGALGAEIGCAALLVVGFFTRLATLPLIFTMAVASFVIHASDPFFMPAPGGAKEPAVLYLVGYLVILMMGPGQFSLDRKYRKV